MEPLDVVIDEILGDRDRKPQRESIEVIRRKVEGDEALFAVEFGSEAGKRYHALYGVQCTGDRWIPTGSSSGMARSAGSGELFTSRGGWSGSGRSAATKASFGAWVNDPAGVRVRLTDSRGRVLTDDVESGVTLLMWTGEFDLEGGSAELLDAVGNVVGTGPIR
jgi:hypothetical protein